MFRLDSPFAHKGRELAQFLGRLPDSSREQFGCALASVVNFHRAFAGVPARHPSIMQFRAALSKRGTPSCTAGGGNSWGRISRPLLHPAPPRTPGSSGTGEMQSRAPDSLGQTRLSRLPYFRYVASHSRNVLYQNRLFCGFSIQWPSSGKTTSRDGTSCLCKAENNSRLCVYGTR